VKRKIILLTFVCLLIALPAFAETVYFKLYPATYPILVDGTKLTSNLPIMNFSGSTYVPLRAVLEMMGARTTWDGKKVDILFGQPPETVAYSVAMIYALKDGKRVSQGSGVILDYDEILTASHVVDNADSYEIIYNFGGSTTAKLKKDMPEVDAAILEPVDKNRKSVKIGDSDEVAPGKKIFVISSPKGKFNTILKGDVINSNTGWVIYKNSSHKLNGFQTTVNTDSGSSGGGVFNVNGELIGIISAGDEESSFVIPINGIRKAMIN
jgi:S1-C subfamily serine protease